MPVLEMTINRDKAETLRALHKGPGVLVLPNAWDVASAKIFENSGFRAIATTSAGIAASLGYADGQHISRCEMLDAVTRIARAVSIPVTADLEAGYATTAEEMRQTAIGLLETGAVGLNLEDGLKEGTFPLEQTSHHVGKIRTVREVCREAGVDLVINARTDIFLKNVGESVNRLAHAIHRGNAYLHAGADCIFVPGVTEADTIGELVQNISGPINILAVAGTPAISELERLGVSRVTFGSGPMRAALGLVERIARELEDHGTYNNMIGGAKPYTDTNKLFE